MKLRPPLFCQTCDLSERQGTRDGTEAAGAKALTVGETRERTAGNVSSERIKHRASKEGHCRVQLGAARARQRVSTVKVVLGDWAYAENRRRSAPSDMEIVVSELTALTANRT